MSKISIKNFNQGGIADSKFMGASNSVASMVGVDVHSEPGIIKANYKLSSDPGAPKDEFIEKFIELSSGDIFAFSGESGKIWKVVDKDTYTLVYTTVPTTGEAKFLGGAEYEGYLYWATQNYLHRIPTHRVSTASDWTNYAEPNWAEMHLDQEELGYIGKDYTTPTLVKEGSITPTASGAQLETNLSYSVNESLTVKKTLQYVLNVSDQLNFRPKTNQLSGVSVNIKQKGTGDWTLYLHDENNTVLGQKTITNANIVDGDMNLFEFASPVNVRKGELHHIHIVTTTGDGKVQSFYTNNLSYANMKIYSVGNPSYHPMVVQNMVLYIGDRNYIHQVERDIATSLHVYSAWALDFPDKYKAKSLGTFETDLLIGTHIDNRNTGAVAIKWNTWSVSYSESDPLPEVSIDAIIEADNFAILAAGTNGVLYAYDGRKARPIKRIPGEYTDQTEARINPNAWAQFRSVPMFGLSNITGEPTKAGVYSLASWSKDYPEILNLEYPLSIRQSADPVIARPLKYSIEAGDAIDGVTYPALSLQKQLQYKVVSSDRGIVTGNIEIKALHASGNTLLVSWVDHRNGNINGVDRLDYTNRVNGAYIETRVFTTGILELENFRKYIVNYVDLPENTNVVLYYKINYNDDWTALPNNVNNVRITDTLKRQIEYMYTLEGRPLQIKLELIATGTSTPIVEEIVITTSE